MLSCEEITRRYSESLERKLPLGQRLEVRLHMLMCRYCSRFRRQIEFLRNLTRHAGTRAGGSAAEGFENERLSAEARQRIKETLRQPPE
jgi:hypothetical protein